MTNQTITDEALLEEVVAWLAEHWTDEIAEELRSENIYWEVSPTRKAWLSKVVEGRWAVPRWPEEWFGRGLSNDQAKIIERSLRESGRRERARIVATCGPTPCWPGGSRVSRKS